MLFEKIIKADTIVAHPNDPQDLNRYAYCRNNPINLVDPTGHSWLSKTFKKIGDFFKEKIFPAVIAQVAVFAFAFLLGGPAAAFSTQTLFAATAAAATTLTLNTGEGRQLIDRVGHEFFDDVLGLKPGLAHTFSTIFMYSATFMAYNASLNALYYPHGPPGTAEKISEAAKSGQTQTATDIGQQTGGIEGRNAAAQNLAESPGIRSPGKLTTPDINGKPNYNFSANSGNKAIFDITKSLTVDQSVVAKDPFISAGGQETWKRWQYLQERYLEGHGHTRSNTPYEDPKPPFGPFHTLLLF